MSLHDCYATPAVHAHDNAAT